MNWICHLLLHKLCLKSAACLNMICSHLFLALEKRDILLTEQDTQSQTKEREKKKPCYVEGKKWNFFCRGSIWIFGSSRKRRKIAFSFPFPRKKNGTILFYPSFVRIKAVAAKIPPFPSLSCLVFPPTFCRYEANDSARYATWATKAEKKDKTKNERILSLSLDVLASRKERKKKECKSEQKFLLILLTWLVQWSPYNKSILSWALLNGLAKFYVAF